MRSILTRLYPFLFLALVVCGPVLLLPHAMPFFYFVATVDSVLTIGLAVLVGFLYVLHVAVPEAIRANVGELAAKFVGRSRALKLHYYLNLAFNFCSMTLLAASVHPIFAGCALIAHITVVAFSRLMTKIHSAAAVAAEVADFKKD